MDFIFFFGKLMKIQKFKNIKLIIKALIFYKNKQKIVYINLIQFLINKEIKFVWFHFNVNKIKHKQ